MKNIVLITGASSGFGELFALQLNAMLKSIDEYWLIARNEEKMKEIAKAMTTPCKILAYDLTKEASVKAVIKAVEREADECYDKLNVKMIINSAGFGKYGNFIRMEDKHVTDMVDLNVKALTMLTKGIVPYMGDNSRIINIASASAFLPQPLFAEYAATKSYVLSYSRALNAELNRWGIYVTAVCPGPANTNFFNVAEDESNKTPWYKKIFMADAGEVVATAIRDSINKKEVSVYGVSMKLFRLICKILPHRAMLRFMR